MAPIIKSVPASELVNPSQQNNVFQFVQTTKPTERSAGVALVAGDRWYKNDDQTEWSWNGTYWVSNLQSASYSGVNIGSTGGNQGPYCFLANTTYSLMLDSVVFKVRTSPPSNATDNWTVQPQVLRNNPNDTTSNIGGTYNSFTDWGLTTFPNWSTRSMSLLNTLIIAPTFYDVRFSYTKNGAAGALNIAWATLYYRLVIN